MLKRVCYTCKEEKDLETGFSKDKTQTLGRRYKCKGCVSSGHYDNWSIYLRNTLYKCKQRANKKNVPFDLKIIDVALPERCPVLDIPLNYKAKQFDPRKPELDRIIPEKGYVKGNVRVISSCANRVKNDCTEPEIFYALYKDALRIKEMTKAENDKVGVFA